MISLMTISAPKSRKLVNKARQKRVTNLEFLVSRFPRLETRNAERKTPTWRIHFIRLGPAFGFSSLEFGVQSFELAPSRNTKLGTRTFVSQLGTRNSKLRNFGWW